LRMARDMYPHDRLGDQFYADVIESFDKKASADADLKRLTGFGVAQLNKLAVARFGKPYAEVALEGDRVTLLYAIEQTVFFQRLRQDVFLGLYNRKEVWPHFGYEGSSWEKGGYLQRGFNDIDWV
jgi:hypothetical protein